LLYDIEFLLELGTGAVPSDGAEVSAVLSRRVYIAQEIYLKSRWRPAIIVESGSSLVVFLGESERPQPLALSSPRLPRQRQGGRGRFLCLPSVYFPLPTRTRSHSPPLAPTSIPQPSALCNPVKRARTDADDRAIPRQIVSVSRYPSSCEPSASLPGINGIVFQESFADHVGLLLCSCRVSSLIRNRNISKDI